MLSCWATNHYHEFLSKAFLTSTKQVTRAQQQQQQQPLVASDIFLYIPGQLKYKRIAN